MKMVDEHGTRHMRKGECECTFN